ncbi:hypothetical protein FGO68_gene2689 [Halteria grandinella]|uniref:Uncharacterized protein n=1 Tax=Halteria grandinella TaxID=5974 RepID=A0A8J8P5Y8_HALGN|nr:hypothetical protein FGO68_gene2689 [Halteria grandinella]
MPRISLGEMLSLRSRDEGSFGKPSTRAVVPSTFSWREEFNCMAFDVHWHDRDKDHPAFEDTESTEGKVVNIKPQKQQFNVDGYTLDLVFQYTYIHTSALQLKFIFNSFALHFSI